MIKLKKQMRRVMGEIERLKWPLAISIVAILLLDVYGIGQTNRWALLAHKFSVVTLSVILAHLVRHEIFPYLDLRVALTSKDRGCAVGSAIVVSVLMAAIILAVALGL